MTRLIAHEFMTLGVAKPRIQVDWDQRPSRYLTIDGVPAYHVGYSCGTCGLVLRRQPGAPTGAFSATEVRDRLNTGLNHLDPEVIDAFGENLLQGDYLVVLLDVQPHLVQPGSTDDYFTIEGPAAWQNEEFEYPIDPANIAYYRLGHARIDEHNELFEFAVPMTSPEEANPATVGQYADRPGDDHPTAVALGLLDLEGPWFRRGYHWGLFHFLLDGHHKTAAAAAAGHPVRLLTFVSAGQSMAGDEELLRLPDIVQEGP